MKLRKLMTSIAAAATVAALPMAAHAAGWSETQREWRETAATHVSAETVLEGDVTNGLNEIAGVDDLVLSPDGSRVQYVLFDLRGPFDTIDGRNAFAGWTNVDVNNASFGEVEVVLSDTSSAQAPDDLALTVQQANTRLVSRLLDSELTFADGEVRSVEDILLDPNTGALREYVVEMDANSVFDADQRRVPASWVVADPNGGLRVAQPVTYDYEVWIL